jgi:hypothetical protein
MIPIFVFLSIVQFRQYRVSQKSLIWLANCALKYVLNYLLFVKFTKKRYEMRSSVLIRYS